MTTALKEVSQIPLFISVDEEGGVVSRLGKANIGVTHLEDAIKLSAEKTPEEVNALATTLGEEIKALGFNMNFAPVLDIHTNPANPVIGNRAFGVDAATVATYANAFNKGLMASGIVTSGKHFPGHGDTATDSHTEQTSVTHTAKRLKSTELVPFKQAIKDGIPTIMMGHITLPNVSENPLPASLSPDIIETILRKDLGFKGIVVTDSLRMKAITDFYTADEVGVLFLQAGGDMILIPDDFEATYQGIINAVNEGKISTARINESVERILNVKVQYGLLFKQED
jgi:beta-N-acetylhexosaminidase